MQHIEENEDYLRMNEEWNEQAQDEVEINLVDLFLALKQKWWALLLGLLLGLILAGIYTWGIQKPTYTASSMIYMRGSSTNTTSYQDLQVGEALTQDYEVIFTSRVVLQEVIDRLGLDIDYKDLATQIEMSNPTDTRILTVSMTSTDAQRAADIVNTLVEVSIEKIKEMDPEEPYRVFEEAIADWTPVGPSAPKNLAVGGLLGLCLVAAYLILMYVWNDKIRTSDDVERALGIPVLCMVPENKSVNYSRVKKRRR